jgi:F-type H+-transporting ATPase subunit delta
VIADALQLKEIFATQPLFHRLVNMSHLSVSVRLTALRRIVDGLIHPFLLNALLILVERGMEKKIVHFFEAVIQTADHLAGVHVAQVKTAYALDSQDCQQLITKLVARFGGTFQLEEFVDPALLGGMTVRVGDWQFDASLQGALKRMNHALYV